jgi:hypothetical protein
MHGVNDGLGGLDDALEGLRSVIFDIAAIPDFTGSARDVHAATGADPFGKSQLLLAVTQVFGTLGRVGMEGIAPGADFGDEQVVILGSGYIGVDFGVAFAVVAGKDRGAAAQGTEGCGPFGRTVVTGNMGYANTHGTS